MPGRSLRFTTRFRPVLRLFRKVSLFGIWVLTFLRVVGGSLRFGVEGFEISGMSLVFRVDAVETERS